MGSTFVEFRGRGFEANDAQIEIWLLLLVDEIDSLVDRPAWLDEAREDWHLQATACFGFGVMPGLDSVVTSAERRDVVLALSSKAMTRLKSYGVLIEKDALNRLGRCDDKHYFTGDVQTELFVKMGDYFTRLVREELGPDETDARIFP
jgi:hypothetical protein